MTISAPATTVTVERTIKISAEEAYKAFTNRDAVNSWLCGNSFVDARENGAYVFIWRQENFTATGIFTKLEENKSLEMTWRSTWNGDTEANDSNISVTFEETGASTKVTLTHSDLAEDSAENYDMQWNMRLDDLKLHLETGALPNIVKRVIIGIWPGQVSDERAKEIGIESGHGTLVTNLVPDFGAEKAGIQIDDVIVAIDGQDITPQFNMNQAVQGKNPGDSVAVTIYRGTEKQTLTMKLSGYPVPAIPETMTALADSISAQYEQIFNDISAMFEGVSEEAAGQAPAEGEWSAKMTLCHLIYSERWVHESTAARYAGNGQPQGWTGNNNTRLQALIDVYPTTQALLKLFRREMDESLAIWKSFPKEATDSNPAHVWGEAFGLAGWIQHTQSHYAQIKNAIEAAQN